MSEEKKEERRSIPVRLASSTVNAISTAEMVGSDVVELLDNLVHARLVEVWNGIGMTAKDFWSGTQTSLQLAVGRKLSVTPETLNITDEQWQILHTAIDPLNEWSLHRFPCQMDTHSYSEEDVRVFLAAARVMTVASALSYVDKKDAQKIVDKNWVSQTEVDGDTGAHKTVVGADRWMVDVVHYGEAEAMLFFEKDPPTNRNPVVILAFRGTEMPDDEASGKRQFEPDWWRNLSFRLTHYDAADESSGSVAEGFLLAWRGITDGEPGLGPKIIEKLLEAHKDGKTLDVFVTGHSQGGALAAVSLLDLLREEARSDLFRVRGCLTVAPPKHCDEIHSRALCKALEDKDESIPFDLVANNDATGVDPVVSLGGPNSKMLAGRFWRVRAGEKTTRPLTDDEHKAVVEAPFHNVLWRGLTSAPLHWPGGPHGYLAALDE